MSKYQTEIGPIEITRETVVVPKDAGSALGRTSISQLAARLGRTRVIQRDEVAFITVSDAKGQYLTANRAAGVVLTGGIALLVPSRKRATLVVALKSGEVLDFSLSRKDAKRAGSIAAEMILFGYTTSRDDEPAPTEETQQPVRKSSGKVGFGFASPEGECAT